MPITASRRTFLKIGLHSGLTYLAWNPVAEAFGPLFGASPVGTMQFPLRPFGGPFSAPDFIGDEVTRARDRFSNLEAYIASRGGRPASSEQRDVVIVGGGIAGLSSAYFLRGRNPLLLEQDPQFGGNSRGEIYGDAPFALGANGIGLAAPNSSIYQMLQLTGALPAARIQSQGDTRVTLNNKPMTGFWNGEADPANAEIYQKVARDLTSIAQGSYPNIPWRPGGVNRPAVDALDRANFAQWLQQRYGQLPTLLLEYLQLYCWTSFNGSLNEVSAAQAINFLASDMAGIMTFPGGNAYIAQGLYNFLLRTLGANSLRSGYLVLEIKTSAQEGVQVLVETPQGQLQTISCQTCVVAVPKTIARLMVPEMTDLQKQISLRLRYRGYVAGHLLLDTPLPSAALDAMVLKGAVPPMPVLMRPPDRDLTEVGFANWASHDHGSRSILSIYKPIPYDGGAQQLWNTGMFPFLRSQMLTRGGEILAAVNSNAKIAGIRLARFGQAMPLAEPGFLAAHSDLAFKQPTAERIFFANQDNDASPSFESAFGNAEIAAAQILRLLNG